MQNRIFFPQVALDQWTVDASAELNGDELTMVSEAKHYRVAEALHVVAEVTGSPDPNKLLGRVKTKTYLETLGAEVLETSMIVGDNAYDVVPGWLGVPIVARVSVPPTRTDEELLADYLAHNL